MNDGARLVGEGARLTAEGGSLYESNRPDGMGNGERHKIWRARSGEVWAVKLEELSNVCDGVVANFGKKLGVGEGFVARKSTGVCLNCKTLLLHL